MLLSKSIIPCDSVIQWPVKALALFTVHAVFCFGLPVRMFRWPVVTVIEILQTRCRIKWISDAERQRQLGCQNGVQYGKSLFQIKILTVKIKIISFPIGILSLRMRHKLPSFVIRRGKRAVTCYLPVPVYGNVTVRTVLEIDVSSHTEPVRHFGIQLHVGTNSVILVSTYYAFVGEVSQWEVIVHSFSHSADADIIVLVQSRLERMVIPVKGFSGEEVGKRHFTRIKSNTSCPDFITAHTGILSCLVSPCIHSKSILSQVSICRTVKISRRPASCLISLIFSGRWIYPIRICRIKIPAIVQIPIRIVYLPAIRAGSPPYVSTETDHRLLWLPFLGRHNNNTIGRLRTIHGSRWSIFQHIYLRYIIGVDFRKFSIKHHTIQNDERIIMTSVRIYGTLAAYTHGSTSFGWFIEAYIQTGSSTQYVLHSFGSLICQCIRTNLSYWTRKVFLTHRAISYHYNLI